ncbi:MAG: serine/threonine-protein phosphatase [Undibacterium sp.]|nr:serine/threonine-protein phosphatase [Opitutaceae bacterium]
MTPAAPSTPSATRPDLRWSGLSHRGKVRPNNEDAFLALAFDGREVHRLGKFGEASVATSDFVFAVGGGMGGAKTGEFASRITVEKITQLLPKSFHLAARGINNGFTDILLEVFDAIHRELMKLGYSYEECRGMGTTLTLGWLTPGWFYFGHIGDSRLYYLPRSGGITQLTHDHTHVGYLRRQGQITEREARSHPLRNALHQALGAGHQFIDPQFGAVACTPGDRFVLCSDGLVDGLWERQIEELIRTPTPTEAKLNPADRLVAASLENSGNDNTTALSLELIATSAPDQPEPAPAAHPKRKRAAAQSSR